MDYEQAIDPDEIVIRELDPNRPDRHFEVTMPAHCGREVMESVLPSRPSY